MILLRKLSFMLPLFFMFSCSKAQRHSPRCVTSTSIEYVTCSASNGCTLSFSCSPKNQTVKLSELPSKIMGNFLAMKSNPKITNTNAAMKISSIAINQPALLQAAAGESPTNWYNNSIICTKNVTNNETNVTCPNFLPIANDFTIQGVLDDQNFTVDVTVDNMNTPVAPSCGAIVCGQMGTTVQRMFDCSQRVLNFAGIGNGDGTFNAFVPGNPDPNWFLVSSPSASDSLQEQCFWLSPIMSSTNPAAGINQFDSNEVPMSSYANSASTKGRFLWSGMSTSLYDFFQANGYNPRNTTPASYDYYYFTTNNVMAQQYNAGLTPAINGPLIYAPLAWSNPSTSPIGICPGNSLSYPSCYQNGSPDNSIYELYSPVAATQSQSLCSTNAVNGINLLLGAAYAWQMPSYPMIMILTGGGGSSCESPPSPVGQDSAFCNGGVGAGVSFNAQDPIPNFANAIVFWSSSISDPAGGWYFDSNGGGVGPGLPLNVDLTMFPIGIRCVSAMW